MARHFGPQHGRNGYAAMGGNMHRPRYKNTGGRSVAEAIAHEHRRAGRMAKGGKPGKG